MISENFDYVNRGKGSCLWREITILLVMYANFQTGWKGKVEINKCEFNFRNKVMTSTSKP